MNPNTRITAATMPNVRLTMIVIRTGGGAAGPHYDYEYIPAQPAAGTLPVSLTPAPVRAALPPETRRPPLSARWPARFAEACGESTLTAGLEPAVTAAIFCTHVFR